MAPRDRLMQAIILAAGLVLLGCLALALRIGSVPP
jgi:hypothetical protein